MTDQRFKQAEFAAWVGIVGNAALAVLKAVVGIMASSKALIADAANSASDVAGSGAVLLGLKAAKKPPDRDHPYGHGKAEPIAAIIVSVLLIIVGVEVALGAVESMIAGVEEAPKAFAIAAILLSITAKEALFQYKIRLGKKLKSQALIANAWDHRSDVYASGVALIGVAGAILGSYLNISWMVYLDPVAGLVVSGIVVRMGFKLIKESIHNTMDHVLHEDEARPLKQTAAQVPGVIGIDEFRAREHGHYVIVDVKISVNPKLTVYEGHEIAKQVKQLLINKYSHVSDVFVHVNPFDSAYPYKDTDSDDRPTILH